MARDAAEKNGAAWLGEDGILAIVKRLFVEAYQPVYKKWFAIAVVCMLISAGATAFVALLMRDIVNDVFISQEIDKIGYLAAVVVVAFSTKGFAHYGQVVCLQYIGNSITRQFQVQMIEKITALSVQFFQENRSSGLIMRLLRNSNAMANLVILIVTSLGSNLVTMIALIGVMVYTDPLMAGIACIVAPVIILGLRLIVRRIRLLDSDEFSSLAAVISSTQETVSGIGVVKAFGLEQTMQSSVEKGARGAEARQNAVVRIKAAISPLMETLGGVAICGVIIYAGWQTVAFGKTPGEFMAILTAFVLAFEPAKRLAGFNVAIQLAANQTRMAFELLDNPNVEENKAGAIALDKVSGRIEFENVEFKYKKSGRVLRGISFTSDPNTTTAIVGPSGAGKSTCFNLLQRLYSPTSGRVLLDGHDLEDVTFESLRSHIALVTQDVFLFAGSVRDNILYGNMDATDAEVQAAAEAALVTEFTDKRREGLDTRLGEGARGLSGGQKQRIAFARAILRDAPILLLDEATSALDNESDRLVGEALARLKEGRTTIVIAHRLSTVISSDVIHYMENGKILESGTHEELMDARSGYYELFLSGDISNQS